MIIGEFLKMLDSLRNLLLLYHWLMVYILAVSLKFIVFGELSYADNITFKCTTVLKIRSFESTIFCDAEFNQKPSWSLSCNEKMEKSFGWIRRKRERKVSTYFFRMYICIWYMILHFYITAEISISFDFQNINCWVLRDHQRNERFILRGWLDAI